MPERRGWNVRSFSPQHYVVMGGERLRVAWRVEVGEESVSWRQRKVDSVLELGLYNPHTMSKGIVPDGVHTSCFTRAVENGVAHPLLTRTRAFFRLGGSV